MRPERDDAVADAEAARAADVLWAEDPRETASGCVPGEVLVPGDPTDPF
jgi:hypothetical protein